jgi:hypothetical protein
MFKFYGNCGKITLINSGGWQVNHLFNINLSALTQTTLEQIKQPAISALEDGQVLYMPDAPFVFLEQEKFLLSSTITEGKSKNISLNPLTKQTNGSNLTDNQLMILTGMMQRYVSYAHNLIDTLLPHYRQNLITGRTSFRPVEIVGRPSSYKKDDKRLHVDAFPATPVQGKRILRVFCNVNPNSQPRVWNLGEPFAQVAEQFLPRISPPNLIQSKFLKLFKLTKSLRTPYDHYMLNIHDEMKKDMNYQQHVDKIQMDFPAGSTWITYTDITSHAALSGQFLLEQTFYLSPTHMVDESKSPLRILEKIKGKSLL